MEQLKIRKPIRGDNRLQEVTDMEDFIPEAIKRFCKTAGANLNQPSEAASTIENVDGKQYVVVRNNYQVLAVYEIFDAKRIRLVSNPPASLLG